MAVDEIAIISSHNINKEKWDACIDGSNNPLIYSHSYYLDTLADNWSGIVVNDYDCVMPIPLRKKMGIRYCYDVPFLQQLGYFNKAEIENPILIDPFLGFVKYGHYNFNYGNKKIANLASVKPATNLVIDLADEESVRNNFTKGFIQSLRNAQAYDLLYESSSIEEAITTYKDLYGKQIKNISNSDYKNFKLLSETLSSQNKCFTRKIINKQGSVLSITLLLKDETRLYNIINAITAEGRKTEANYFLYEQICNEFAGKGLLFDLEGSELAGVKSFYKKMGAFDQPYYRMKINNLPFPLKLLKS